MKKSLWILFMLSLFVIGCNQQQGALPDESPPQTQIQSTDYPIRSSHIQSDDQTMQITYSTDENQIVKQTNEERIRNGLSPLKVNSALMNQARMKAQDMVNKSYFSHDSPTFGSPFDQIKKAGIRYTAAGENIAGNPTANGAFQSWMKSTGHRANILNRNYNQIGVGVINGGPYGKMLVQMFILQ